jgi:hypothetical protein
MVGSVSVLGFLRHECDVHICIITCLKTHDFLRDQETHVNGLMFETAMKLNKSKLFYRLKQNLHQLH